MSGRRNRKSTLSNLLSYSILILISLSTLYPAMWVVLSSLREGSSLYSPNLIPKASTLEHYIELFESKTLLFKRWYWNTLKISIISMVLGTLLTTLVAYAFSRFRFYGRRTSMSVLLSLSMFPGFMSMIAIYVLLLQMKLLDTHIAVILVYPQELRSSAHSYRKGYWIRFRGALMNPPELTGLVISGCLYPSFYHWRGLC